MMDANSEIKPLTEAERVLKAARMLPMTMLTAEDVAGVRADYIAYTKRHGIFDATVAKQVGFGTSTLNQWRNGRYEGDVEEVARRVNNWIERDAKARSAALTLDYVPTRVAEEMRAMISLAQKTTAILAMVVPSGAGKSLVLELMAKKLHGRLITAHEDLSPSAFLREVARAVEVGTHAGTAAELLRRIVAKLKGTGRALLIDEAHQLSPKVFSRIRTIHDLAGVPVILAGTYAILDRISDQANAAGQLASRCLSYNAMDQVYAADGGDDPTGRRQALGRPLFTKEEVSQLFERAQLRLAPEALALLWALACLPGHGCLRLVRRVVQIVADQYPGQIITADYIRWGLKLQHGLRADRLQWLAQTHIDAMEKRGVA